MQVAKISSKGQITIPKFVREVLYLSEGDKLAFVFEDGKISIRKVDIEKLKSAIEE
ncbi:AbrB/MazE/SpoVT family DNA-binding domain-containing protein [Ammoniphilus sp. 3BR4]|uniref:AbrB/MazE/SpoVT family DNA-binding domain-containing protein n=1 Tax=Ammoniphilus sp. 3BR4 TaxID=3158265 RepID=UPI003465B05B